MPKSDSSRHLSFATNPLLSIFLGNKIFYANLHFSLKLFVRICFENETNFSLNFFKNQIKLKNSFQNSFKLCKISTFNFFLSVVYDFCLS